MNTPRSASSQSSKAKHTSWFPFPFSGERKPERRRSEGRIEVRTILLALALLLPFARPAYANGPSKAGGKGLALDKKQIVQFDGDTIDGDLLRPDGDLMAVRPEVAMPNLVVPPATFQRAAQRTLLNAAAALPEIREQKRHAARP